uniref:Uncharacterized protein n=1 Tax=Oryza brachyantha TaxID=4533 RepID=J3LC19_ORYBR
MSYTMTEPMMLVRSKKIYLCNKFFHDKKFPAEAPACRHGGRVMGQPGTAQAQATALRCAAPLRRRRQPPQEQDAPSLSPSESMSPNPRRALPDRRDDTSMANPLDPW